jgi:hypothetical protein
MLKQAMTSIIAAKAGRRLAAAAVIAMTGLAAGPAFAVSPATNGVTAPQSLIEKVHYCHRSCEFGYIPRWGVRRWHRHVGPGCHPVRCVPRAAYPNRCWVDAYGVRRCRW